MPKLPKSGNIVEVSPKEDDTKREQRASDRILYNIGILGFVPAIPLLTAHGAITHKFFPAFGLVPAFVSALFCALRRDNRGTWRRLNAFIHLLLAVILLGMLIPGWIFISSWGWRSRDAALCGAYGTMPLMANFCIHTYMGVRDIKLLKEPWNVGKMFVCVHCQHCKHAVSENWRKASREGSVHSRESSESYHDGYVDVEEDVRQEQPVASSSRAAPLFIKPRHGCDTPPEEADPEKRPLL